MDFKQGKIKKGVFKRKWQEHENKKYKCPNRIK